MISNLTPNKIKMSKTKEMKNFRGQNQGDNTKLEIMDNTKMKID